MNTNSSLKPYWGKPAVRNFRGRGGDTSVPSAYSRTLNGQCVSSSVHVVRLFSTRRCRGMSLCRAAGAVLSRTSREVFSRLHPAAAAPFKRGNLKSPTTLSGSQDQASGFAGGVMTRPTLDQQLFVAIGKRVASHRPQERIGELDTSVGEGITLTQVARHKSLLKPVEALL
jgi:hypothetical protein